MNLKKLGVIRAEMFQNRFNNKLFIIFDCSVIYNGTISYILRMDKVFLVFTKGNSIDKENVLNDCTFIQEKFSYMAFFFTFFWLLYHRLWNWVALYVPIIVIFSSLHIAGYITEDLKIFIFLATSLYIGIFGSMMLQKKLVQKGYLLKSVILANNKGSALSKFLLSLKVEGHIVEQ